MDNQERETDQVSYRGDPSFNGQFRKGKQYLYLKYLTGYTVKPSCLKLIEEANYDENTEEIFIKVNTKPPRTLVVPVLDEFIADFRGRFDVHSEFHRRSGKYKPRVGVEPDHELFIEIKIEP